MVGTTESALKSALGGSPASVSVNAGSAWQHYSSGVLTDSTACKHDHACWLSATIHLHSKLRTAGENPGENPATSDLPLVQVDAELPEFTPHRQGFQLECPWTPWPCKGQLAAQFFFS